MSITIDGTNGFTTDNGALKLDGTTLVVDDTNNRVGIGTASPAVAMDVSGQVRASSGILFGTDTAAANALDDYEEGTWTATLTGGTTAPSTPVTTTGYYTKIGNLVTVFFRFTNVNTSGASGSMLVTGLPFSSKPVTENQSAVPMTYGLSIPNKYVTAFISGGASNISFLSPSDSGVWADVSIVAGSSKYMNMSISYQTD
jgi:hypothetical protein